MRIDKFLKVSRILKRRSVAKDAGDGGRIKINGNLAKPSKEVKVGDEIELRMGMPSVTAQIRIRRKSIHGMMATEIPCRIRGRCIGSAPMRCPPQRMRTRMEYPTLQPS